MLNSRMQLNVNISARIAALATKLCQVMQYNVANSKKWFSSQSNMFFMLKFGNFKPPWKCKIILLM